MTVDVFIPFSKAGEFMDWYRREINFFPLWCVPYKRVREYEWIASDFIKKTNDELFLDLAIYGMKRKGDKNYYKIMEDELMDIGALKTLISNNYYTESDFWKVWNKENYDRVKKVTDPTTFFATSTRKCAGDPRTLAEDRPPPGQARNGYLRYNYLR